MVFGEIVEPSTRAFLEDDDYEQYKSLEWDCQVKSEENIKTLFISETQFANQVLEVCILDNLKPLCTTLGNEVKIFRRLDDCFILCNLSNARSIGEVLEYILPWLQNSEMVFALTTAPIATFQNRNDQENSSSIMRELSTNNLNIFPRLETPNLITGVGAGIQSYCVHTKRSCTLFICYVSCEPLDSMNSKPLLDLLEKINLTPVKKFVLTEKLPTNNLYM